MVTKITKKFWEAFKAYINELAREGKTVFSLWNYWYDALGVGRKWDIDEEKLNTYMAQEIGKKMYPLDEVRSKPEDQIIFKLIEFFFKIVAIPIFPRDPREEIQFDQNQGKLEYNRRINQLFDNFRLRYIFRNGKVETIHSEIIDKYVSTVDFDIPDKETETLIKTALDKFYSRDFEDQKIGLEKLVDACQRITTREDPNKKKSIKITLQKVSVEQEEMKEILDEDWKELWKIANKFMIRHTEKGKIPINDIDSLEYLFYAYFNVIRFILKKYGYIKEKEKQEQMKDEGVE